MKSWIDIVSRTHISGWASDLAQSSDPLRVQILVDDAVIGTVTADRYRPDLEEAGIGTGAHGFEVTFDELSPDTRHVVQARDPESQQDLANSPWIIEAETLAPDLRGFVDAVVRDHVVGWAMDNRNPDVPVVVEILDNDRTIAHAVADRPRTDLADAGIGNGRHGFELIIPGGLTPLERHVVRVRFDGGTAELDNSPQSIDAEEGFGSALRKIVSAALETLPPGHELDRALDFLVAQAELLRKRAAGPDGPDTTRRRRRVGDRRTPPAS